MPATFPATTLRWRAAGGRRRSLRAVAKDKRIRATRRSSNIRVGRELARVRRLARRQPSPADDVRQASALPGNFAEKTVTWARTMGPGSTAWVFADCNGAFPAGTDLDDNRVGLVSITSFSAFPAWGIFGGVVHSGAWVLPNRPVAGQTYTVDGVYDFMTNTSASTRATTNRSRLLCAASIDDDDD